MKNNNNMNTIVNNVFKYNHTNIYIIDAIMN